MKTYYPLLLALMLGVFSTATIATETTASTSQAPQSESKAAVTEKEPECD